MMQHINNQSDGMVIQDSIDQILKKQKKWFEDKIWQQMEIAYEKEKNLFLKNINEFKNDLLAFLNDYLNYKKLANESPNENSLKLLSQLFMEIQQIKDIPTGKLAYQRIVTMFHPNDNKGSPTLYDYYVKKLINNLNYYFSDYDGKCLNLNRNFLFSRDREKIENYISVFQKKTYSLINKKYGEMLSNDIPLKEVLTKLDSVLNSITHFCKNKADLAYPELASLAKARTLEELEKLESDLKYHYEYKSGEGLNPWHHYSNKQLIELATSEREIDEKNYKLAQENELHLKNETLKLIKSFLKPTNTILSEIPPKTGDYDIDQAFHAFITQLKQDIVNEKNLCLLETNPQDICKRLEILMGEKDYFSFINHLGNEIRSQFSPEEFCIVTTNKHLFKPQMRQNNFTLFGTVRNLPPLVIPQSLSDNDAIHFLYGNKGL